MIETQNSPISPPSMVRSTGPMADEIDPIPGAEDDSDDSPELVIRPQSGWIAVDWKEVWAYHELLFYLIRRDIAVRYKQTILGPAWAVVQPLMMMVIFTLIFGRVAQFDSEGFPYPVFVFAGLLPWTLFSQGTPQSALSLVNQQHLLTKVYFPRLFVPIAAAAVFLVDLAFSLGIYAVLMAYYRVAPSWTVVFLPALILLTLVATLGIGILIAGLTVFYRDLKHIVPFLVQIFMYVTPVIYSVRSLGQPLRSVLALLNPMFGIVAAYRSAILGVPWDLPSLAISSASALALFLFAVFYFRRTERRFADFA
jgi:lipopolysaccharide transport system permease protein